MATILGEANLSTSFTSIFNDTRVATFDTDRDTTTDYRRPMIVSGFETLTPVDQLLYFNLLDHYNNTGEDYIITGTGDPNLLIKDDNGSNVVGSRTLEFQFDFTDIDQKATFDTNSLEIEIDLQSSLKGYEAYSGNENTGDPYFGSYKVTFETITTHNISQATTIQYNSGNATKITSSDRQTITIQMPGHFVSDSNFGLTPTVKIQFFGTVNNPLVSTGTADGNFSFSGRYGQPYSYEIRIFSVKARYHYTGRTNLTTGFTAPTGGDYGFTNMIPSTSVYKGMGTIYRYQTKETSNTQNRQMTLKNNTNDNLLNATGTNAKTSAPNIGDQPPNSYKTDFTIAYSTGNEVQCPTVMLYVNEYTDEWDDGLVNEVIPTISMFRDSNLDLVAYFQGAEHSTYSVLARQELNIAYMPELTGSSLMNTGFTTTVQGNLIHNILDSEMNDMVSSFTMTTLGGFRLKDPVPEVDVSFTVDVTANPVIAPTVETYSSSFSVQSDSIVRLGSGATSGLAFGVTVVGTVLIDTALSGPLTLANTFTFTPTANNTIGVTGLTKTEPSAAFAIASLSGTAGDIDVVRRPSDARRHIIKTETRTYITNEFLRTITPDSFTRIYVANEFDRTITLESFTTTIDAEFLL